MVECWLKAITACLAPCAKCSRCVGWQKIIIIIIIIIIVIIIIVIIIIVIVSSMTQAPVQGTSG